LKNGNKKTLQEIIQSRINYRRDKHPLNHPNAGSIFKNVDLNKFSLKLKESLASVVKNDPLPVVPTAHLIFQAGLKGRRIGNAQISEKHPNFIVNLGGATAEDVLGLISLVKREIKKIYRINLETECMILK
jgi:UDP-N-acetylmuramate dehydrogenase